MVASKEMNEYWRISSGGQYKKGEDVDAIVGRTPIAIPTVAVSDSSIETHNLREPMLTRVKSEEVENPLTGNDIKNIINLVPGMTIEDLNSEAKKFPALSYNARDTTAIASINNFSHTTFLQKEIEVDGSIESFGGDLRIKIEPSQGRMVTSAESITASKDFLLDSVQWLKDYKLAGDKRAEEGRIERAKSFLKLMKLDPTDPAYDEYLAKQIGIQKEVEESMPFSGGIKFVQNIDKIPKITNAVAREIDLISKGSRKANFESNPFNEAGSLKPNIKYKSGEYNYSYETDGMGRISKFETDNLKLTNREGRLDHNPNAPGKLDGDHAGHLAGDRFGGSPELDNLVSQSSNVNLSQYKKIENQWAQAIKDGKQVKVNVEAKYEGDGLRPSEFNVQYEIDGKYFEKSILN